MADFIRFTKCPIEIDGKEIFATNASMSESLPLQRINSLGWNGAVAVSSTGPPEGSWSVDLTYTDGMNTLLESFQKNWDDRITVKFAANSYTACVITSLSYSADANAVVTCSIGGNSYSCLGPTDGIVAGAEQGPKSPDDYIEVGHGSKTDVVGVSSHFFNFNWEASRTLTSIYRLGSAFPIHLDFSDETITASAQGNNLQECINADCEGVDVEFTSICPKQVDVTFEIGGLCGEFSGQELKCDGFVQDRNIEVSEGDVLRGNLTIVDWYNARTAA